MKVYSYVQPCRGMTTGSRTGVLSNSSNTASPTSYMVGSVYYDEYGRPNYTHNDNQISSGYDKVWTEYDFDGDVMETKHVQYAHGTTTTKTDRYTYDHNRRPLNHYVKIGTHPEYLLSQKAYKETDQLNYNRLGNGAQQVDYLYNINGWMTKINNPSSLGSDLFAQELKYHNASSNKQYNGNIASLTWRNSGISSISESFTYDNLNRLLGSTTTGLDQGTTYSYDDNGNLDNLIRKNGSSTIDNLNYFYNNLGQLNLLEEEASTSQGYTSNVSDATFSYDLNGNMTYASNKSLTISYNQFNLPKKFDFGANEIDITYDAAGMKLKKTTNQGVSKDYISGFEYENSTLKSIYHEEGWIEMNGTTPTYKFFIKDHLGNTRVTFRVSGSSAIKETEHAYYPFGMEKSIGGGIDVGQDYLYNGKEMNNDFGLDLIDYGARWYDPAIGRWHSVDPLSEKYTPITAYAYVANNPIIYVDPDGMRIAYADGMSRKDKRELRRHIRDGKRNSKTFRNIFKTLKKDRNNTHTFSIGDENSTTVIVDGDNKKGNSTNISIDLNSKISEGKERPLAVGIGHELGHAYRHNEGLVPEVASIDMADPSNDMVRYLADNDAKVVNEEKEASHIENIIRAEYNPSLGLREVYSNIPQQTAFSVIQNKRVIKPSQITVPAKKAKFDYFGKNLHKQYKYKRR